MPPGGGWAEREGVVRIQKTLVSSEKGLPLQRRVVLSTSTTPSPPKAAKAAQHPLP